MKRILSLAIAILVFILIFHQIVESFTGLIAPYCVVVLAGRQPACVLRLVWHNNPAQTDEPRTPELPPARTIVFDETSLVGRGDIAGRGEKQ